MGSAYAIIRVSNGSWKIEVETNNLQQAHVNFHNLCEAYWNSEDVKQARVYIVDQALVVLKREDIIKDQTSAQAENKKTETKTEAAE